MLEAVQAARKHGTIVSYDLNYRPSLWKSIGGQKRAQEVNREIAKYVDVMIGNEEDFTACLGFEVEGADEHLSRIDVTAFKQMIEQGGEGLPELQSRRHHAAHGQDRHAQRLGRDLLGGRQVLRSAEPRRTWKSSTAWAAATASPAG